MRGKLTVVLLMLIGIGGAFGYYTIHSLRSVITQLAEEQQKLEQHLRELTAEKTEGPLQDIEQTLELINQQLKFGGDAKAALEMLEGVETRLLQPVFDHYPALRLAVHSDLEQLRLNPIVDKAALWFRLQQFIEQLQPEPVAQESQEIGSVQNGAIEKWKGAFQGLVSIHKRDGRIPGHDLFPLLYIEQAMWAILYDQPKIYEQSLLEAEKMLEPLLNAPKNQTLKKELENLKAVQLPSGVITVDQSIHALVAILKEEAPHV
jgi:uncharacterized protein HemX